MPFPHSHRGALTLPNEASATRFLSLLAFKLRRRGASDIEHAGCRVEFHVEYEHRNQAGPLFLVDGGRIQVLSTDDALIAAYEISTQGSALVVAVGSLAWLVMAHYGLELSIGFAAITAALGWIFLFGTAYAVSQAAWRHFFASTIREITARPHN